MENRNGFQRKELGELLSQQQPKEGKKSLLDKVKSTKFDAEKPIAFPNYVCTCNIENKQFFIGALSHLVVVTGKSKSRKSTFLGALCSAFLDKQSHLGFNLSNEYKTMLYFDTESLESDFQYSQHLILKNAAIPFGITPANLEAYQLIDFSPAERLQIVCEMVDSAQNLGFLVIDGIADLITNFNDLEQSYALIAKIQSWQKRGILVFLVIHENPTKGEQKMRGHLGTLLEQKANTVIGVTKNTDNDLSIVSCKASRKVGFPSFSFGQNEHGLAKSESELADEALFKSLQGQYPELAVSSVIVNDSDVPF